MIDKTSLESSLRAQLMPEDLMHCHTIAEAGNILKVGKNRAYELVNSGDLLAVGVGERRLVSDYAIKLFVIERQLESFDRRIQPMKAVDKKPPTCADKPESIFSLQGNIPYNNTEEELQFAP